MTKYDPRKNAEGYNDPTPYAAEKHMMAQIRGKQARVAVRKPHGSDAVRFFCGKARENVENLPNYA